MIGERNKGASFSAIAKPKAKDEMLLVMEYKGKSAVEYSGFAK